MLKLMDLCWIVLGFSCSLAAQESPYQRERVSFDKSVAELVDDVLRAMDKFIVAPPPIARRQQRAHQLERAAGFGLSA